MTTSTSQAASAALRVLTNAVVLFAGLLVASVGGPAVSAAWSRGLGLAVVAAAVVLVGAAWRRAA